MNASPIAVRAAGLGLAVVSILSYYAVGADFYDGYWIPQGFGMNYVPDQELAHTTLFVLFGLAAMAGLLLAVEGSSVTAADLEKLRRIGARGTPLAVVAFLVILVATLAIAGSVLGHAVTTDDEHVYRFIAETLRTGHLTAPSPGTDLDFFREQFVVLTERVRYGKYPIGHPVLLAIGQALGVEAWVVPIETALGALALFALGARVAGRPVAALGVALYALSPQVLLTGATLLSQPLSALCLVAGLWCLVAAEDAPRPTGWLLGAGAALGYGVLVRPLPGALFVLAAVGYVALDARRRWASGAALRSWLARLLAFAAPLVLCAGVFLLVNRLQTGSWVHTGYDASDAGGRGMGAMLGVEEFGIYAMSLASHLLRLDLWLFGWPISLALCAFAPCTRRRALLWWMIGAAWAYRLLAPKAGVAATGPLYLFETVPLLCLLTADGLARLVAAGRLGSGPTLVSGRRALGLVLAGTLVSLAMFVPVKLANLQRMGEAQLALPRLAAQLGLHRVLVFAEVALPGTLGLSWAYFPRVNSPTLDDDILHVRFHPGRDNAARALEFWHRRYPDRTAWFFAYFGRTPRLVPLEEFLKTPATTTPGGAGAARERRAPLSPSARRGPCILTLSKQSLGGRACRARRSPATGR